MSRPPFAATPAARSAARQSSPLHLTAAAALAGARQALEHPHHARMPARIVGAALAVRCADRGARHAHGGDAGALLGAVREVGGDGNRRGGHGLVAVLGGPALPRGPQPER